MQGPVRMDACWLQVTCRDGVPGHLCYLLSAVATLVATSALHDQPFRAASGLAVVSLLDAALPLRDVVATLAQPTRKRNLHD